MVKHVSKVLVSGGAGFIGSHIVDRLLAEDYQVVVLDNLSSGNLKNIPYLKNKNLSLLQDDIRNFEAVKKALRGVDAVFHEAGLVSVILSVQDPIFCNDVNVTGTLNLLKASVDLGVKRFVFASSAAVYGENPLPLKKEDMHTFPSNPYGISKLVGENYARVFHKLYGLETVCLRYFNVYGPRQSFNIEHAYGGVITLFLNRLLKNLPPIIYGDGEQSRDFVFVQDIIEANMLALNSKNASGGVFNVGSGISTSINRIAQILKALLKKDIKNICENPKPGDVRHGFADISKAKETLNYVPKHPLEEGLKSLVEWSLNQLSSN
jgi:UDP-glucose 4-epimerase